MTKSEFYTKMKGYLETVETEKDGEEMRDAITKALITLDMFNAGLLVYPTIVSFKENLDNTLNIMWEDIFSFYPTATRPTLPVVDRAAVMNDELEDILKSFMNSVIGSDIRSAVAAGCRNVYESIVSHNFVTLYYLKAVDDMFVAFIEACDDEEKRATVLATRDQWYATDLIKSYQQKYETVLPIITSLIDTPTGAAARPLLLSVLNNLKLIILEEDNDTSYVIWSDYAYVEHGKSLEMIANMLIEPEEFSDFRYNISAGGPYVTQGEAESRYTQVITIDTENTYDVVDLFNDERRGFYVVLNHNTTEDGWYLTYAGAYARARSGNQQYGNLNLTVIDSPYKDLQGGD